MQQRPFKRAVRAALLPGGIDIARDRAAAQGSPADVTDPRHRIEPSTVLREVEAAGSKFEAQSPSHANLADPHTAGVIDKPIRGRTEQFILMVRRPQP